MIDLRTFVNNVPESPTALMYQSYLEYIHYLPLHLCIIRKINLCALKFGHSLRIETFGPHSAR